MRKLQTFFIAIGFAISLFSACQNPEARGKGNYHKDLQDSSKKSSKDSVAATPHTNPEDTIRKY